MPATPLEALAEELGAISGQLERETRLRMAAAIADLQRHDAERELRFSKLERQIEDRLASLKDGASVSVEDVTPILVAEIGRRFAELPKPENGKDVDPNLIAELVTTSVRAVVAALPPPAAGKDADPAVIAEMVSRAVAALPPPEPGAPGKNADPPSDEMVAAAVGKHLAANPPKPGNDAPPVEATQVAECVAAYFKANPPAPGKDADPNLIAELVSIRVNETVAALPPPEKGKDADPAAIAEMVSRAVAALPPAAPGKDADPEFVASSVEKAVRAAVAALPAPEKGDPGPIGALPVVKAWEDRVHYQSNVVTHAGSLYQASRDTAKEPPHADWVCLAAAGEDGADGRTFTIRGTYQDGENYDKLDVVALNGASFAAKRDKPGACPGDGWQLIAKQGELGRPSKEPGPRGKAGPKVEALSINDEGLLTLRHEDGSTVTCDLYPLLAKIA